MYKILNNHTPKYLQEMFTTRTSTYNLRDSENKLSLPLPRTDYLKRTLSYSGALLWNSPPKELRSVKSLGVFKNGIDEVFS